MRAQGSVWVLIEHPGVGMDGARLGPHYWFTTEEKACEFAKERATLYPHMPRLLVQRFHCVPVSINDNSGGGIVTNHDVIIMRIYGTWRAVPSMCDGRVRFSAKLLWPGVVFKLAS